jgi:hypothetical protein
MSHPLSAVVDLGTPTKNGEGPMNVAKMLRMLRAYRAGAPLGDVVVLKLDALSASPSGVAEKLAPVRGYAPEHDLAGLREHPSVAPTLSSSAADSRTGCS